MQTREELYYIAGLFDGEGSIMLLKNGKNYKYLVPTLSMTSTSKELLDILQDRFGGAVCKQRVYKTQHKQSWSWRLAHARAVKVCKDIWPLLLEPRKRKRAKLIADKYLEVTPRNGKYSSNQRADKVQFEKDFIAI